MIRILLVTAFLALPVVAPAQKITSARVSESGVNIFSSPSIRSGTLYKLQAGESLDILEVYEYPYLKVRKAGTIGYVHASAIQDTREVRNRYAELVEAKDGRWAGFIRKFGKEIGDRIQNKEVWPGMTEEMLKASWGLPTSKNVTESIFGGKTEQWVYRRGQFANDYVYVENGVVTTIQKWSN